MKLIWENPEAVPHPPRQLEPFGEGQYIEHDGKAQRPWEIVDGCKGSVPSYSISSCEEQP